MVMSGGLAAIRGVNPGHSPDPFSTTSMAIAVGLFGLGVALTWIGTRVVRGRSTPSPTGGPAQPDSRSPLTERPNDASLVVKGVAVVFGRVEVTGR